MASAGRILMFPVGDWISGNDYGILDIVYHEGSSYIAKVNINGSAMPPSEDTTNWQIHARGFGADALSEITATDTSGALGTVGASVISQALIDVISDKAMTKLIPYVNIVNNFLATNPNTVLSGPMGKSLKDQLEQLNSNLAAMRTPILLGKITAVGSISINASLYREIALYIKTSAGGFLPPVIIHTNLLSASPVRVHPTMFYGVSNYLSTTVDISLTAINYVSSSASESSFSSLDAWGIK